jgi:hypothetical protein
MMEAFQQFCVSIILSVLAQASPSESGLGVPGLEKGSGLDRYKGGGGPPDAYF